MGGILLSIGYIILHLGSISYLIFYRKLGFRYHLKTCRILILVPQMFLLINSQVWIGDTSHPHSASFVPGITKICLSWVLLCHWCVCSVSLCRNTVFSTAGKRLRGLKLMVIVILRSVILSLNLL